MRESSRQPRCRSPQLKRSVISIALFRLPYSSLGRPIDHEKRKGEEKRICCIMRPDLLRQIYIMFMLDF